MIEQWNHVLFLALNGSSSPDAGLVAAARILAAWPVPMAALMMVGLWIWSAPEKRGALLASGLGLAASVGAAFVIAGLWYHPRPAELGIGHILMFHEPETSFPSDHATFLFGLGLSLITTRAGPVWGVAITLLGVGTAWARVYLGVHFPLDMAGALALGLLGAWLARVAHPIASARVLPLVDPLYENALKALRLPPSLFPRRDRSQGMR